MLKDELTDKYSYFLSLIEERINPLALTEKVAVLVPSWQESSFTYNGTERDVFYQSNRNLIYDLIFQQIQSATKSPIPFRYSIIRYYRKASSEMQHTPTSLKKIIESQRESLSVDTYKILQLQDQLSDLLANSEIVVKPAETQNHPTDQKYIISQETVDLILIDYDLFMRSALDFFGQQLLSLAHDKSTTIDPILLNSISVSFINTMQQFLDMEDVSTENCITHYDTISYNAKKTTTKSIPQSIWRNTVEGYGIFGSFSNNQDIHQSGSNDEIPLFLSIEALFCWELVQSLKFGGRCIECSAALPFTTENRKRYQGKFCPPTSKTYVNCQKSRNRKRQNKHYRTKT